MGLMLHLTTTVFDQVSRRKDSYEADPIDGFTCDGIARGSSCGLGGFH